MPQRAPATCRRPGCAGLVTDGVCSVCGPQRRRYDQTTDQWRGTAAERGYDANWQALRFAFLTAHPFCVACRQQGRVVVATDVDHIIPKREGGTDDERNLQPLCHACHAKKTRQGR